MKKFIAAMLVLAGCTVPAVSSPTPLVEPPTATVITETRVYPTYTVEVYTVTPVLPTASPTPDVPIGILYAGPLCYDYYGDSKSTETATINMTECYTKGIKYLQYEWGLLKVQG